MKTESRRGRPRKFDEDQTLDQIMQVFWKNGYAATSLDQIAAATGLNRPSLYSAFGGKKDMYLKTVSRFADKMEVHLREAGKQAEGAKPRLKAIMYAAIDLYTGKTALNGAPYGCLAISTLPSETAMDTDFQKALADVTARMDGGFARLIRHEVPEATEVEALEAAQSLALVLHGASVRARAGEQPETLRNIAARAVDRLCP